MSIKTFFKGKPERIQSIPLGYNPQQQQLFSQLGQMGMQNLQNPYQGFAPIAQQAQERFQQQTIPSIMQRLSNMGLPLNGTNAYAQQLGQAGRGLQGDLAAQQAQFGQGNLQNALAMLGMGLTRQNESMFRERQPGAGELIGKQLFGNLMTNGPQMLGQALGGMQDKGGGMGGMASLLGLFL
jgi:hypothetical protein